MRMSTLDLVVLGANGFLAVAALVVHIVASLVSDPRKRPLHASIAVVCLIYALGYAWVVYSGDRIAWSRVFSGVSLIVWPLVWCAPAIQDVLLFRRDLRVIKVKASDP